MAVSGVYGFPQIVLPVFSPAHHLTPHKTYIPQSYGAVTCGERWLNGPSNVAAAEASIAMLIMVSVLWLEAFSGSLTPP